MKENSISVKKLMIIIASGFSLNSFIIIILAYLLTHNAFILYMGILLIIIALIWGFIFMYFFQKQLAGYTTRFCQAIDKMIHGDRIQMNHLEEESLFSRMNHRINHLYQIMQDNQIKIKHDKENLQALLSDISHQTKTPISNLKIINETLMTKAVTKDKKIEFLKAFNHQLNKLDFLIQALLKASQLESGAISLIKKAVPITETLAKAINGVLAMIDQKEIDISIECPQDLIISHDAKWTAEALFNILDNAVKYTPALGSIRVAVADWEMYVKIDIADSGRGIVESKQAMIFQRFYREKDVHEIEGIGIGLYLTREIITKQGGYIKVTSKPKKGSTFSVFLPKY